VIYSKIVQVNTFWYLDAYYYTKGKT